MDTLRFGPQGAARATGTQGLGNVKGNPAKSGIMNLLKLVNEESITNREKPPRQVLTTLTHELKGALAEKKSAATPMTTVFATVQKSIHGTSQINSAVADLKFFLEAYRSGDTLAEGLKACITASVAQITKLLARPGGAGVDPSLVALFDSADHTTLASVIDTKDAAFQPCLALVGMPNEAESGASSNSTLASPTPPNSSNSSARASMVDLGTTVVYERAKQRGAGPEEDPQNFPGFIRTSGNEGELHHNDRSADEEVEVEPVGDPFYLTTTASVEAEAGGPQYDPLTLSSRTGYFEVSDGEEDPPLYDAQTPKESSDPAALYAVRDGESAPDSGLLDDGLYSTDFGAGSNGAAVQQNRVNGPNKLPSSRELAGDTPIFNFEVVGEGEGKEPKIVYEDSDKKLLGGSVAFDPNPRPQIVVESENMVLLPRLYVKNGVKVPIFIKMPNNVIPGQEFKYQAKSTRHDPAQDYHFEGALAIPELDNMIRTAASKSDELVIAILEDAENVLYMSREKLLVIQQTLVADSKTLAEGPQKKANESLQRKVHKMIHECDTELSKFAGEIWGYNWKTNPERIAHFEALLPFQLEAEGDGVTDGLENPRRELRETDL